MAEFTQIATDTQTMQRDIEDLTNQIKNVESELKSMFSDVERLNTMWAGPANAAFVQQCLIDYNDSMEMVKTVLSMITSMEEAKNHYTMCENEVSGYIQAIKI